MSDKNSQDNIMKEIEKLQLYQIVIEKEIAAIRTKLEERCPARAVALSKCQQDLNALWKREHQREGGKTMLIALMTAAGAAGGVIAKFVPWTIKQ